MTGDRVQGHMDWVTGDKAQLTGIWFVSQLFLSSLIAYAEQP